MEEDTPIVDKDDLSDDFETEKQEEKKLGDLLFSSSEDENGDNQQTGVQEQEAMNEETEVNQEINNEDNQDNQEEENNQEEQNEEYGGGEMEFGDNQDNQEQQIQLPEQDCLAMPYPKPPDNVTLYGTKLPGSLLLQPIPFDPDLYQVDTKPVISLNEADKPIVEKTIHNAVRWRYAEDEFGDIVRESNSRIVTWSDGSMTLLVGKEPYEIIASDYNDYRDVYVRQRPEASSESFLQNHGILQKKLSFNPSNIDKWRQDTMNFRNIFLITLRKAVQRGVRPGSKFIVQDLADPDAEKKEKEKMESYRNILSHDWKEKKRQELSKRKEQEFNADYLEHESEEDQDQDSSSQKVTRNYNINENKILAAKKGKRVRFSDSEEEDDFDEGDLYGDEEDAQSKKKRAKS